MKMRLALPLAACGIAVVCLGGSDRELWNFREEETIAKTLALTRAPMRVVIDNLDGYVHAKAATGPEVRVTAHKLIRAEAQTDLEEAKREVKLDITGNDGSVSVYYEAPWRCNGGQGCRGDRRRFYNVTYDIDVEIPKGARPVLSTVNHGDIELTGTEGNFDISNVNGAIRMNTISGSGDVHTVNGPITVHFAQNPTSASSFKTVNGAIDVYFPRELSADLSFKTFNGEIYSDFEVVAKAFASAGSEQQNGKFVYRSNRFRAARAGRGGPELTFDTLNGNIRLHRER